MFKGPTNKSFLERYDLLRNNILILHDLILSIKIYQFSITPAIIKEIDIEMEKRQQEYKWISLNKSNKYLEHLHRSVELSDYYDKDALYCNSDYDQTEFIINPIGNKNVYICFNYILNSCWKDDKEHTFRISVSIRDKERTFWTGTSVSCEEQLLNSDIVYKMLQEILDEPIKFGYNAKMDLPSIKEYRKECLNLLQMK